MGSWGFIFEGLTLVRKLSIILLLFIHCFVHDVETKILTYVYLMYTCSLQHYLIQRTTVTATAESDTRQDIVKQIAAAQRKNNILNSNYKNNWSGQPSTSSSG